MNNILDIPIGVTTNNSVLKVDIKDLPHLLLAGQTGGGKSSMLESIICSLLMKTTPDDLLFMMVDSKMVELTSFEGIPNLLCPVVTDAYEAIDSFHALVNMMEARYESAQELGAKDLDELNEKLDYRDKLPYIIVVVDEVADLMLLSKRAVEESIVRIAAKARAVGIHLVIATQSPRREIITGILRANLPSKIGFSTSSALDSRIILDKNGCENLTGLGDALFSFQGKSPIRVQTPYVSPEEIKSVVDFWKAQNSMPVAA